MKKFLFMCAALLCVSCKSAPEADIIIQHATVITLDKTRPRAQAAAIRQGRILFVGSDSAVSAYKGQKTRIIDAGGRMLIPGFIEGHAHFMGLGKALLTVDLRDAQSWDAVVARVARAAAKADSGVWIIGRGWHQEKWKKPPLPNVQGYPLHKALSAATPDNPVLLGHASGHGLMANARAMAAAGITRDTPAPEGGVILRDADGDATGVFLENAETLIYNAYQRNRQRQSDRVRQTEWARQLETATQHCLENGVTTFFDAGAGYETIDFYKQMIEEGKLRTRLWVMVAPDARIDAAHLKQYRMIGGYNGMLTVRAVKQYADGALGSRGAWMLEPYSDMPGSVGQNVTPMDSIARVARAALQADFQVCTHAIGDRANRETLNVYARVLRGDTLRRWRIEHAQHIDPADQPRFKALGVIASIQTVHCTSDGSWALRRIGEKRAREGAYVWQNLLKSGAHIANGTDAPVERLSPIENFYAAVTRRLPDGRIFYGAQRLNRLQALKSLTLWNAYAGFLEKELGSISPGKRADLVLLSQNLLTVDENRIPDTKVLMTVLGGKIALNKLPAAP